MSSNTRRFVSFRIYLLYSYLRVRFQIVSFVREHIRHKALLMGYSMRLELIRVCGLNDFQLVIGLYGDHPLLYGCLGGVLCARACVCVSVCVV